MNDKQKNGKILGSIGCLILCLIAGFGAMNQEPDMADNSESNTQIEVSVEREATEETSYQFRNQKLLEEHYDKHGKEMGFSSAKEYEDAASDVVNDPTALHKNESEDNDDIFYVESTNDFVIVSTDGYIRTYFRPDRGKAYYDKQ